MAQLSNYLERLRCPTLGRPEEGHVEWSSANLFGETQLVSLDFTPNTFVLSGSEMKQQTWKIAFGFEDNKLVVTHREGLAENWPKTKGKLIEVIQKAIDGVEANPQPSWIIVQPQTSPSRLSLR